jgi:hypothetical protein
LPVGIPNGFWKPQLSQMHVLVPGSKAQNVGEPVKFDTLRRVVPLQVGQSTFRSGLASGLRLRTQMQEMVLLSGS